MSAMRPDGLLGPWAVAAFGVCAAVVLSISYFVTADGTRCTGAFFCGSLLMSAVQRFINWRCISIFEMPAWAAISLCLVTIAGAVVLFVLEQRQAEAIQEGPRGACGDECPSAEDPASVVREALLGLRGGAALSERELEVACGLACGHSVAEIAQELGVSASTVSTYRARAYEKLGVETNAQLVASLTRPSSQPDSEDAQKPIFRSRLLPGVVLAAACVAGCLYGCYGGDSALVAYSVALVAAGALLIAVGLIRIGEEGQSLGHSLAGVLVGLSMSAVLVLSRAPGGFLGLTLLAAVLAISVAASTWAAQKGLGSQQALGAGVGLLALSSVSYSGRYIGPWMLPCFTLACIAAAAVLLWVAARGERGKLVENTLDGEVRVRSYLEGRGLSSLEAGVALMAVRGATATETALALSVSPSSVAAYRSRGLKKLGVEGIGDLRELLKKDAGLALTVGPR